MDDVARQGHFALLRWRVDPTRDEARNVAVLLAASDGEAAGGLRAAPISSISPRLHEQGILDDVLVGLAARLEAGATVDELKTLRELLHDSLVLTEPQPVAVGEDVSETLQALYRAYVVPRTGARRGMTKGVVLDKVVSTLRSGGADVSRGAYVEDFIFDLVVKSNGSQVAGEVLSFAVERKDWTPVEREAGHFLFALQHLALPAIAVVEPPTNGNGAAGSYDRVRRWLQEGEVQVSTLDEFIETQPTLFAHESPA